MFVSALKERERERELEEEDQSRASALSSGYKTSLV